METDMQTIETFEEIAKRWKAEGKTFRPRDLEIEWRRQGAWLAREREDDILANLPNSEVAGQIRDHRAAGNWTTQQREPAASTPHI